MKSILILVVTTALFCGYTPANDTVKNEEAIKQLFAKTFPNVHTVNWYKEDDRIACIFTDGTTRLRLLYDKYAVLIQAVRYYGKELLPPMILTKVVKKYPDAVINSVTEICTEFNVEYYVHLDNADQWITLKADPYGFLQVHSKMKKAK